MGKEMGLAIIKAQLLKNVSGATSSDTIGGMIIKGLFSGFHDAGGMIPAGSTGVVGEYGPELVKAGSNGALV